MRERFHSIFSELVSLGFNAVPAHPLEKHPSGAWKGLAEPSSRRVTAEDVEAGLWVLDTFPGLELECFLFPSSHPTTPLVVIDIDDMDWAEQVLTDFGDTPYVVTTRRGVHCYYRADPARKVTSRNWLYGERSVDCKAWGGGVMAPGSLGGRYAVPGPLRPWDLPEFNYSAYERVWAENRPKARAVARKHALAHPSAYLHVAQGTPALAGDGLELMGDIAGDTVVKHERSSQEMRMDCVPEGDKVYAFDRADGHASGQVWVRDGRRFYTDHTLGVLWRVVTGEDLEWQRAWARPPASADQGTPTGGKENAVSKTRSGESGGRKNRGIDPAAALITTGYLEVEQSPGLTIIKAPHGCGKTELASRWMATAATAITVANTTALAEHNAVRFDIESYQRNPKAPKLSTTINSLVKASAAPVSFFHIDEADQVHGFLHSGTMSEPVENLHALLDHAANAEHTLITSADLSEEDIEFFTKAYRARTDKPIRVFERPPTPGRRHIRLVPLAAAKRSFDDSVREAKPGDYPLALGWTARTDVANLAWGYAAERPDLRVFWTSGENSRYHETIERFRGQWSDRLIGLSDFLASADVFIFSPTLQSGVSLTSRVAKVWMLHTKPDFEAESVAQMLMRFRDVEDIEVVWGMAKFTPRMVRTDDVYLNGIANGLADATDQHLAAALPEYTGAFPFRVPLDAEFAESWRITQRKIRRSYADPVARVREVIEGHGWTLHDDLDAKAPDAKAFNKTKRDAAGERGAEVAQAIAHAADVSDEEARRIDKAHVQTGDESQRLARKRLRDFYALDVVTEAHVLQDGNGKFRAACRLYAHTQLVDHPALAFRDWERNKGRQAPEYQHVALQAQMRASLVELALVDETTDAKTFRLETWVAAHAGRWKALFPGREGPRSDLKWLHAQLRRIGADITRDGRKHVYDFSMVKTWSEAYRLRLEERYEHKKENEKWHKHIRNLRTST